TGASHVSLPLLVCPGSSLVKVAVGATLTGCPPHRSRRASLPHRAPASGHDAQAQHACRTQSCACDRVPRPCVRPLWYSTRFPLASPLLSTPSANSSALELLFEGFVDTMRLSDSLHPCSRSYPLVLRFTINVLVLRADPQ